MTDQSKSFLFTTLEAGGVVAPTMTLARRLMARGHRVRVMSDACSRAEIEKDGATFIPWTRAPSRPTRDRKDDLFDDWAASAPGEGIMMLFDTVLVGPALKHAQDVMEELAREPADLVVCSEMLFGAQAGCEAAGVPFALLTVNTPFQPVPGAPPLGSGLAPARTDEERALHAAILAGMHQALDSRLPALNAARAALGLAPIASLFDQCRAADLSMAGTARAFDFPVDALPPKLTYIRPLLGDPRWTQRWTDPFAPGDARPLVLVSFSTTFQNHAGALQRVLDALAGLPVRAVVTLGDAIRKDELTAPANVALVDSAPHAELMKQASLVVTHGGHGTVIKALAAGLPMLILPHGRDQGDNAIRVTARGAGLALPNDAPSAEIAAALRRLLDEPSFTEAARRLGAEVAREAEQSPAVELLEQLAGSAGRFPRAA
jgi:MGT family glycosyltransferase